VLSVAAAPPSPPATDEPASTEDSSRAGALMTSAVAVLLFVVSLFGTESPPSDVPAPPRAAPVGVSAPPVERPAEKSTRHLPRSKPVRLRIPEISVDAPFTDLAIGPKGQLEAPPPDDINLVGWHAKGPSPGEIGTSIIAGHVDTKTSPAVFVGLGELEKGDKFHVLRADGRKASFVVDDVETFDKDHFPDDRVYADADRAEVRLITCAGEYDRTARDYTENLVVFAHLV
jgi:LPXTG-site transpeptidase (sortase) family protein